MASLLHRSLRFFFSQWWVGGVLGKATTAQRWGWFYIFIICVIDWIFPLVVSTMVILTLFSLMRLIFGLQNLYFSFTVYFLWRPADIWPFPRPYLFTAVSYFHDCPQHPNIPNYLLGLVLVPLLMIPFVIFPCESHTALEPTRGFKLCLLSLIGLFALIWGLGGKSYPHNAYFIFCVRRVDISPLCSYRCSVHLLGLSAQLRPHNSRWPLLQ